MAPLSAMVCESPIGLLASFVLRTDGLFVADSLVPTGKLGENVSTSPRLLTPRSAKLKVQPGVCL